MNIISQFLNLFGKSLGITDESALMIQFIISLFVLSVLALFCIFNIVLYLTIFYVSENKSVLDFLSRYPLLLKIFNIYKKTRIVFLVYEFGFLIFCVGGISLICFRVLSRIVI